MDIKLMRMPIKVRDIMLKNRLVMPPLATAKSDADGSVSEELLDYYAQYAGGNIGLIIVEHAFVANQGRASENQLSVSRDSDIEGLSRLASVIKANGTKAFMQISHAGSATRESFTGEQLVAPSAQHHPGKRAPSGEPPRALSADEIRGIAHLFAAAALRVKDAGFDGVELHGAHGYLLNQFYSPLSNSRTDEYGGSLENRLRIHREVIAAVREAVGDFPIAIRFGGSDYKDGGNTAADAVAASVVLETAGIDLLDITGGMFGFSHPSTEPGWFRDMTENIKRGSSIPVILTGGVQSIEQAERLLAEGAADLIGVGRAMLADSSWADKALGSVE